MGSKQKQTTTLSSKCGKKWTVDHWSYNQTHQFGALLHSTENGKVSEAGYGKYVRWKKDWTEEGRIWHNDSSLFILKNAEIFMSVSIMKGSCKQNANRTKLNKWIKTFGL